ncbi:MAG: tetratricopeptide repeat protein [Candidatus Eiseniibacteriota bacterium]
MTATSPRGSPRRTRDGLVLLGSFLVALGAAEVVVRAARLVPAVEPLETEGELGAYRRSKNAKLGFELRPDFAGDPALPYPGCVTTNSHGQRDLERTFAKAAGSRRAILLGDSIVEGHDIADLDDTISRQLERLSPDGSTEVLNFGVSGYCTRAEVELLETKGLRFDPDDVILVFVENDYNDFNRKELELAASRPRLVEEAFVRSHLFRFACLRLDLFGYATESEPPAWDDVMAAESNVTEGLRRLSELRAAHGFDALVAVWPRFLDDDIVDVHRMEGEGDRLIVERLAETYGLATARLSPWFRADHEAEAPSANPRERYTIGDHIHPSVEGCRVAARALHELLEDSSWRSRREVMAGHTPDPAAEAAARAKNAVQFHVNRGDALAASGDTDEASRHYAEALKLDRSLVEVRAKLAAVLQAGGDLDRAIDEFREALDVQPAAPSAHFNLAMALGSRGEIQPAAELYREALRMDPGYEEARLNLGILLAEGGQLDEAISHFREAVRVDGRSAKALNNLGLALSNDGRPAEAVEYLERALALDPSYAEAHHNLALALLRLGRPAPALERFRAAIALEPDGVMPRVSLAWVLATHPDPAVRDPEEAVRLAEAAARLTGGGDPAVRRVLEAARAAAGPGAAN